MIFLIFSCMSKSIKDKNIKESSHHIPKCEKLICYLDIMGGALLDTSNCEYDFKAISQNGQWINRIEYYHNDYINIIAERMKEESGEYTDSKVYFFWNSDKSIVIELRKYNDLCDNQNQFNETYLISYFKDYIRINVDCEYNIEQVHNGQKLDEYDKEELEKKLIRYKKEFNLKP